MLPSAAVTDTLRSILPAVYRPFLPDFFDTPAPVEVKATCASCAMCPKEGAPAAAGVTHFRPDAKCCTFHPRLPNYLVGAILADDGPEMEEGRRRIRAKIAGRTGITPRWIEPPRKLEVLLRASRTHAFGRSLVLLCPYFEREGALCTIWRHREIACTTFFCKHVDGADGEFFWRSVRALGGYVERALSLAAAQALMPGWTEPPDEGLTIEDLEDRPPREQDHAALWGAWAGREEELYVRSFEWVRGLDRARFEALVEGDAVYRERLDRAEKAHREIVAPTMPERLVANPAMKVLPAEGGVIVTAYSRYEPLHLTAALHEVVRAFGPGETVAEVRARLQREEGIEIPDELLVSLYRFQVLVPPVG
jgi:Fe-S-cluster containining protein